MIIIHLLFLTCFGSSSADPTEIRTRFRSQQANSPISPPSGPPRYYKAGVCTWEESGWWRVTPINTYAPNCFNDPSLGIVKIEVCSDATFGPSCKLFMSNYNATTDTYSPYIDFRFDPTIFVDNYIYLRASAEQANDAFAINLQRVDTPTAMGNGDRCLNDAHPGNFEEMPAIAQTRYVNSVQTRKTALKTFGFCNDKGNAFDYAVVVEGQSSGNISPEGSAFDIAVCRNGPDMEEKCYAASTAKYYVRGDLSASPFSQVHFSAAALEPQGGSIQNFTIAVLGVGGSCVGKTDADCKMLENWQNFYTITIRQFPSSKSSLP